MPSSSNLRFQSTLSEPLSTGSYYPSTFAPRSVEKKQKKMSLTQTYYIAASARSKLGREASRSDHNLRLLVGHANLLDSLMIELANAERDQEAWFNQTLQRASAVESSAAQKASRWADTIQEEDESTDDEEDFSDSDSEFDEEDFAMITTSVAPRLPAVTITSSEIEDDDESDDEFFYDEEDDAEHALIRVSSHPPQSAPLSPPSSPPELISDDSLSSSEDDLSDSEDHSAAPALPTLSPARKPTAGLTVSEHEQLASKQEFYTSQSQMVIASC